jgi:S-adenosylmethionine-dependent methyltransferase
VRRLLVDGVFLNDVPDRFTGGYGARPQEVAPFFERHGLHTITLLASTGFIPDLQEPLATLRTADPAAYEAALDLLIATASDPSILGMATHLLYVAQKG